MEMENHLTPTEQKLQTIMKFAPLGLLEINENGDLLSPLNIKGEQLLTPIAKEHGFDMQNVYPLFNFIHPPVQPRIQSFTAPGGLIMLNELCRFVTNENGTYVEKFFSITVTKMYPGCVIVSVEDYTDKHLKEQAMHQAEVDKAVEHGKFEIASGVLHDIGNAVVGFGSYLTKVRRLQEQNNTENLANLANFISSQKTALAGALGEEKAGAVVMMLDGIVKAQKNNNEEIKKSITEQLNIISHVQEILNIQRQYVTGKETQERKPVNLRNIINDCLAMLFASFDKRNVDITVDTPPDLPLIKGDRTKLMQVILNLLKNSLEAIDLNAAEKKIAISAVAAQQKIQLRIKDTGKGFDEETGGKLFERGFTTKSSGSGIGLYNCRKILESHNATIQITSAGPGKGSETLIVFTL